MDAMEPREIVFALCHEIGNLVGAVRLHAHLLDDQMSARDLARTSLDLDDLSARAAALLGLVRPILSSGPRKTELVDPSAVVGNVERIIHEHGGRGATLRVEADPDLPAVQIDQDVLHCLLQSLLFIAIEAAPPKGTVLLQARTLEKEVIFTVEDDAPVDEDPARWREQMQRGRPLLCTAASDILSKRGGRLEAGRSGSSTRVALVLPVA